MQHDHLSSFFIQFLTENRHTNADEMNLKNIMANLRNDMLYFPRSPLAICNSTQSFKHLNLSVKYIIHSIATTLFQDKVLQI